MDLLSTILIGNLGSSGSGTSEWIQQADTDCGDLFIDCMVWILHPQVTPKLGGIAIEGKNPIREVLEHLLEPLFQQNGLRQITTMAN